MTSPAIRILIIDNDTADRDILGDLLRSQGHDVIAAANGVEGLRLAREARPDLIILDVMMPGMDGFTVCATLRAERDTAEVPIIMATALDDRKSRLRCLEVGADEFLNKPLDTIELRVRVSAIARVNRYRRLLDERERAEREIRQLNAELEVRVAERTAELRVANDYLRELNAFKDSLLATTSHDLRSPLANIQVLAESLMEEHTLSEEAHWFAKHIYDNTQRLAIMVSNMLDLSKLESGKVNLMLSDVRFSDIARQAIDALRATAQAKRIQIDINSPLNEPYVSADPLKLLQISNNLLSNAIKFTPAGGHITVRIEVERSGVCLHVADTGLGIPADALPHVFDKFHQIHDHGTAGEKGSGLGLAIVQQLVELHGGTIEVSSVVQQGSTFSIRLPSRPLSASPLSR